MKRDLYPVTNLLPMFFLIASVAAQAQSFISKPRHQSKDVAAPALKITASSVSGATRYTIELNTSPDFSAASIVEESSKDFERTLTFNNLAYATTYYARVKTDLADAYGKVSVFTTRKEIFPVPEAPGADSGPEVVKLIVRPVPGASRYTTELSTSADFSKDLRRLTIESEEPVFLFRDLAYSTRYYARSITDASTTFGPVVSFRTKEEARQKRLWGVTTTGGGHGYGTVFSFSVDSATFIKHHDYLETSDYPSAYLSGSLTHAADGGFYGNSVCENNGTCANGEVFYVSPEGRFELRYTMGIHAGSTALGSDNNLYVIDDWTNYWRGGIWKLDADGSASYPIEDIIFRFRKNSQGLNPRAALLDAGDGYLYGMAPYGGLHRAGTVFRIRHDGEGFEVLHHFDPTSGAHPNGSLTRGNDGALYGTTAMGGRFNGGVVFRINPDGNGFRRLFEFSGLNGKHPMGNVVHAGDLLYGTTSAGGVHDMGTLFVMNADGSKHRSLVDFNGENGAAPLGAPVLVEGRRLFVITSRGGSHNMGVLVSARTNGAGHEKLLDFTPQTGGNPDGSLLLKDDTFRPAPRHAGDGEQHEDFGLFPNPFLTTLTASWTDDNDEPLLFVLSDLHGNVLQVVEGVTNSNVALGGQLGKGVYLLKVVKGEEVSLHRIVKK